MLYIRADANHIIGTGHIMRCCAIADAVKCLGEQVTFIVADGWGETFVEEKGYPCIKLNSQWNHLDFEIHMMQEIIVKYSIKKLLIDTYYVTNEYMGTLKEITRTTYIDDLHQMKYPCHRLLNYAIYAGDFPYEEEYQDGELLLGCEYVPLRREFKKLPCKKISSMVERVLVLTGGTDNEHFIRFFLQLIIKKESFYEIQFDVVCGRYNEEYPLLVELVKNQNNIKLHKNLDNLYQYMQQADVAVSAGGTTLYELCAIGTPTICYTLADNQLKNVWGFQERGIMYYCGDIRTEPDCYQRIEEQLIEWKYNPIERKEISNRMQKLVDGNGAYRIAKILVDDEAE